MSSTLLSQPSPSEHDRSFLSPATPINPFATPRKSSHPHSMSPSPLRPSSAARSLLLSFSTPSTPQSVPAVVLKSTSAADTSSDGLLLPVAAIVPPVSAASSTHRRPLPSTPATAPSRLQRTRQRSASRSSTRQSTGVSPSRRKRDWWPTQRHHSPAGVKRAKEYGGLHHSTGIVSSAADEMKGEKRQQVERDMQAWQQRIDSIHHRQHQSDTPSSSGHAVQQSAPTVKRALFAAPTSEQCAADEKEEEAEADDVSGDDGRAEAEDDVTGVELLLDSGVEEEK